MVKDTDKRNTTYVLQKNGLLRGKLIAQSCFCSICHDSDIMNLEKKCNVRRNRRFKSKRKIEKAAHVKVKMGKKARCQISEKTATRA